MKTTQKEIYLAPLSISLQFLFGGGQIICGSQTKENSASVESMEEDDYNWEI